MRARAPTVSSLFFLHFSLLLSLLSSVFIEVHGRNDKGEHKDHVDIVNTTSSSFERGAVDRFPIALTDIGEPYKLRVGHDGTGLGAGWHLHKVTLSCPVGPLWR
jgi:hypothetical protein